MKEQNNHPHDDFFKVAFSRLDIITDYIHQFLDKAIVKNIDFKSLILTNNSYITQAHESFFADIVWECNYGTLKSPIKISVLFEHKSYVPKHPHLQLLRYMLEIWDSCIKQSKDLTPVIPIIVYHNKDNRHWNYKPFWDYFEGIDASLLPYLPSFEYQLTDLTTMSDAQIFSMNAGILVNALMTLQFGSNDDYVLKNYKILLVDIKDTAESEHLQSFFIAQLVYVLRNTDLSGSIGKSIIDNFKNKIEMSTYDRLMQTAEQVGIEKGRQEGMSLKEIEKQKDFTISLLNNTDFDNEKIALLVGCTSHFVVEMRSSLGK